PEVGKGVDDNAKTDVHVASVGSPTHDLKRWGQVALQDKLDLLYKAFDKSFLQWHQHYDPDATYIFTAPEYYFSASNSHFLAEADAAMVWQSMRERFAQLPSNFLVIPGTTGWRHEASGNELRDYRAEHAQQKSRVDEEMTANELYPDETSPLKEVWEQEPDVARPGPLPIYHNDALVFSGEQPASVYSKRYESTDKKAFDRTKTEQQSGYFHLGRESFTTQVNGIPIKLEICSDNAYESIAKAGYEGIHILLGSHFGGQQMWSAVHGQTYIHTDSTEQFVSKQEAPEVAKSRKEASGRNMKTINPTEVFTNQTHGNVTLSFFRVAMRQLRPSV
ncbi:MAG TPA: hypothetical protein VNF91_03540, partial [Candidatus Acidoferrum sp.]|nr:hypothetical protein [Candidatus Acidoferrum sp.]